MANETRDCFWTRIFRNTTEYDNGIKSLKKLLFYSKKCLQLKIIYIYIFGDKIGQS